MVLAHGTDFPQGDETWEHGLTTQKVASLKNNPAEFVSSVGGAAIARDFLAGFIDEIQVHPDRATICYALPLPKDSPHRGETKQDLTITPEALA